MTYHAKLIKGGKVVIPAELRRAFGLKDGDTLVFERHGDALTLKSYAQVIADVQADFRKLVPDAGSVDGFIAKRAADWDERPS